MLMKTESGHEAGKILKVLPNWMEEWDNRPGFKALVTPYEVEPEEVDGVMVHNDQFRYEVRKDCLYKAQIGDVVHFMYSNGKPTDGFGGRQIELTMKDGEVRVFKGGWSSNSFAVNKAYPENPCVECSITDEVGVMERGYTFTGGAVSIEGLVRWWSANQPNLDWGIAILLIGGDLHVEPIKGRYVKMEHTGYVGTIARLLPNIGSNPYYPKGTEKDVQRNLDYFMSAWHKAVKDLDKDITEGKVKGPWFDPQSSGEQLHITRS